MKFTVIGINDAAEPNFSAEILQIIAENSVFSGGTRHYSIVKDLLPKAAKWINITPALTELFAEYEKYENIVVFASGDPLFYGFVATIQRLAPGAEIHSFPSFNSLQLLSHQLRMPYQDMINVSLTGRPWDKFDEALIKGYSLVGVLTDTKTHTPSTIAQRMLDYGYTNYEISVGELLGNNQRQKVQTLSVEELSQSDFQAPNCLILRKITPRHRSFGIEDSEFELLDGRKNMITKKLIRLASISELALDRCSSFWDVGFCTGSVSIEAKSLFPSLNITSFEIREEGRNLLETNAKRFGLPGIKCVIGDFLEQDLDHYPRPDAVFIGGHGGKLQDMLSKLAPYMNSGARLVFNSVSLDSYTSFIDGALKYGFRIQSENKIKLNDYNLINVITAEKV